MIGDEQGVLLPAPPEAHDEDQAKQVFIDAFHNVQDAASNALGEEVPINALCIPNHLNATSIRSVFDAAVELELPFNQPAQVIRWLAEHGPFSLPPQFLSSI